MINVNSELIADDQPIYFVDNRGFKFADAVFETLKYKNGKLVYTEAHYFRLMASLRMLRMDAPMHFTLEYFESEILKTIKVNNFDSAARIRFTVFRKNGGLYKPLLNEIEFVIEVGSLNEDIKAHYELEIYKDFYVYSGLLSTIKSTSKTLNVIASIFADENGYDNCILINENKQVVEAINGNVFLVKGNTIITAPLSEGCLNGIIRSKLIELLKRNKEYELEERPISPFELKKVDEVFITNSIIDIQPVMKYRKKIYNTTISQKLRLLLQMSYS